MTSLNAHQEHSLTAFLTALSQQEQPLPAGLQRQINAIGQNLENRVVELPAIAASLTSLNQAYQAALAEPASSKSAAASTQPVRHEHAVAILTDADPVKAAQRHTSRYTVASNPLKRLFGKG